MVTTLPLPENLFVTGNVSFEAFEKINAINTRTLTKLAELQFNLATLGLETTVEQAKVLSNAGNYQNLYSVESSLANHYNNKLMEISRETTDVIIESSDEFATVIEDVFDHAKRGVARKAPVAAAKPAAAKKTRAAKPVAKKRKAVKKSA